MLGAATKYDMPAAIARLREVLVSPSFLKACPIRVYAIASRFDLEEEAKIASQYTLNVNILTSPLSEDLKYISAYSYHRILDLHRRRAEAAQLALEIPDDVKCMQCNGSYNSFAPPRWWAAFREKAKEELRIRPTTKTIFSLEFLMQTARASGCQRCAGSILDSYAFLETLKEKIDALPSTI